jgi:hypothetical protein
MSSHVSCLTRVDTNYPTRTAYYMMYTHQIQPLWYLTSRPTSPPDSSKSKTRKGIPRCTETSTTHPRACTNTTKATTTSHSPLSLHIKTNYGKETKRKSGNIDVANSHDSLSSRERAGNRILDCILASSLPRMRGKGRTDST